MFDSNIENSPAEPALPAFVGQFRPPLINRRDLAWTLGVLAVVTLFCDILQKLGFSEANIITLDILAVLIIAGFVSRREYGFLASAVCVLVFNFLFTTPRYAFKADDIDTQFTLLVMLISAFITSSFAARFKRQARIASLAAYRTGVLLETNQLLQQENSAEGLLRLTAAQLNKLLKRDTLFCPIGDKGPGAPELFCTATPDQGRRGPSPRHPGGTVRGPGGLFTAKTDRRFHGHPARHLLPLQPRRRRGFPLWDHRRPLLRLWPRRLRGQPDPGHSGRMRHGHGKRAFKPHS